MRQNSLFRYANLIFPYFWYIIVALLPFRHPLNDDILYFAGMPTINARGLDRFRLLLFLLLSAHIVFARFLLSPTFSLLKILFVYIFVRTLCDTCNSISYVLYFSDVICFIHLIVLRFCFLSQLPGHDFIIQIMRQIKTPIEMHHSKGSNFNRRIAFISRNRSIF